MQTSWIARWRAKSRLPLVGVLAVAAMGGCSDIEEPTGLGVVSDAATRGALASQSPTARATGGGRLTDPSDSRVEWEFAVAALQRDPSGEADGNFHFSTSVEGQAIEFHARVTCLVTDAANGRAWIGGTITKNASERAPFKEGAIYQEGQPAWFRVADYGEGSGAPKEDRGTRIFFTGTGGFLTADAFCHSGLWPIVAGDERLTSPLLGGNIQVKP
jgi:hypothetical protein